MVFVIARILNSCVQNPYINLLSYLFVYNTSAHLLCLLETVEANRVILVLNNLLVSLVRMIMFPFTMIMLRCGC